MFSFFFYSHFLFPCPVRGRGGKGFFLFLFSVFVSCFPLSSVSNSTCFAIFSVPNSTWLLSLAQWVVGAAWDQRVLHLYLWLWWVVGRARVSLAPIPCIPQCVPTCTSHNLASLCTCTLHNSVGFAPIPCTTQLTCTLHISVCTHLYLAIFSALPTCTLPTSVCKHLCFA